MTQTDLLNLSLSISSDITTNFGQVIAITFAMVIGIYYFLNQAKIGMKIFAFIAYTIGMFMFFGLMVSEGNVSSGIIEQFDAIPDKDLTRPAIHFLSVHGSWVFVATSTLINLGFFVLWLGVAYLLFVWKKDDHIPPAHD